jgi:hypothetical protein
MDKGLAAGEARVTVRGKVAQGVPLVWGVVGAAVAADADWVSMQARATSWIQTQLNELGAAIQKLTERWTTKNSPRI